MTFKRCGQCFEEVWFRPDGVWVHDFVQHEDDKHFVPYIVRDPYIIKEEPW